MSLRNHRRQNVFDALDPHTDRKDVAALLKWTTYLLLDTIDLLLAAPQIGKPTIYTTWLHAIWNMPVPRQTLHS